VSAGGLQVLEPTLTPIPLRPADGLAVASYGRVRKSSCGRLRGHEGRPQERCEACGEALARPVAVDEQRFDDVGGDQREEHVGRRRGRPRAGEAAFVGEASDQAATVGQLLGDDMSAFTEAELRYLDEMRLARLATTGADGTPHVTPVGFRFDPEHDTIDIGGFELERTKKYRDVERSGRAAVVIDDNPSVDPWRVRGIEIRGPAEALAEPTPLIRVHARRIISWGIESETLGRRHARTVPAAPS